MRRHALLLFSWASSALLLAAEGAGKSKEVVITNIWDENPGAYVPLDEDTGRPAQLWKGNYTDVAALACSNSGDLLFDWPALRRAMAAWLQERSRYSNRIMQTYWEEIRPLQHALTNIVSHHGPHTTSSRDCHVGMLAVRVFFMVVQTQHYRDVQVIAENALLIDWYYYTHLVTWANLARSGWGIVVWHSISALAKSFADANPWLLWADCEALPTGVALPAFEAVERTVSDAPSVALLKKAVDSATPEHGRMCPVALAYAASLVALAWDDASSSLAYLDRAQGFLRLYREVNDYTFINLLHFKWPLWSTVALVIDRVSEDQELALKAPSCGLIWCPDGGTPNQLTCACEVLFPEDYSNITACIFMVDTRRRSSLRNITSVLNARFWTLTYGINRLYAEDHGYEIEYVKPENETHFPDRKVGWGKVKVVIDRLREYGSERCAYGVSIDTDAYFRSSEPLAAVVHHYGLDESKLILFSQEYHTEQRPNKTFINGGFFIVRNSPEGVRLLEEWYNVPEDHAEMAHLKKDNPQGLNICWDEKIQPRYADSVVLGQPHLFTAPLGSFVRHNWFKILHFEQEMMDVLLHRLQRKYGCIMCQNVYDWDDSLNIDVGWR